MAFDPSTATPEDEYTPGANKPVVGGFDPATARLADEPSIVEKAKDVVSLAEKLPDMGAELAKATAVDIIDMVLGFPGMIANVLETGALNIAGLAQGDMEAAKHTNVILAEAAKDKAYQASLSPVRIAAEVAGKPVAESPIGYLLEKGMAGLQARGEQAAVATGTPAIAEATPQLANAAMAWLGARAMGKAAAPSPELKVAAKRQVVKELVKAQAEGLTTDELALGILKRAKEQGVPGADQLTTGHIKASLEDIAEYYGTGIEKRTGARAVPSQLAKLAEVDKHLPPEILPTEKLWNVKYADRAKQPTPEVQLDTIRESIKQQGIVAPVTVLVSTKDNLAFLSDGNHRVTIAHELDIKDVPVRVERTSRSFNEEIKAKAKTPEYLGITEAQIKNAPEEIVFEKKPARVTPEEIDFGGKQQEIYSEQVIPKVGLTSREQVINALPPGIRKAALLMEDRANRGMRGGLVIGDIKDTDKVYFQHLSKLTGTPVEIVERYIKQSRPVNYEDRVGAFYNPATGNIYLNTRKITTPEDAAGRFLHEIVHASNNDVLNAEVMQRLQYSDRFFDKTKEVSQDFYSRVRARMQFAGERTNPREATSYFVEEATRMGRQAGFSRLDTGFWEWASKALPADVLEVVKQWVANIRATMYKYGVALKESDLTVDDILALTRANLRELAKGTKDAASAEMWRNVANSIREDKTDKAVTVSGVHYSPAPRDVLEGSKFGTGIRSEEAYRLSKSDDPRIKTRIAFYVDEGKGTFPEQGVGTYKHQVTLTNLYDAANNPLGLPTEAFMHGELAGVGFNKFESAVLDAGYDGYYVHQAFGRQGAAVLLGDAAKAVKVPKVSSEALINVGLHTNDGVGITPTQVEAALRNFDITTERAKIYQSGTEPTYVAELSRPLTAEEAHQLSINLKQEAIAQSVSGRGELHGPKADAWRPFNPDYFITPEGVKLSSRAKELVARIEELGKKPKLTDSDISEIGNIVKEEIRGIDEVMARTEQYAKGQAFKQRGAIGLIYVKNEADALKLIHDTPGAFPGWKKTPRGYQIEVPMDYRTAEELYKTHPEDVVNLTKSAEETYKANYFKKQRGAVDKQLIATAGLMLGGGLVGAILAEGETTQGLLLGAALGFGAANLPRATNAIAGNWKSAIKTGALGVTYAAVGATINKDYPVEGILLGSAVFGLRFLPKVKYHPEDQLINARNGNIQAEKRLSAQVRDAMKQMVPDEARRIELTYLAEDPKFVGRNANEQALVEAHRGYMKSYYESAKVEGLKIGLIEGYVAHIVEDAGRPMTDVGKVMAELFPQRQYGVAGQAKFTKERMYPTLTSLEQALEGTSLRIKTKDIAEIDYQYAQIMTRTIENQKLINALKETTWAQKDGHTGPLLTTDQVPGYAKLSNPQLLPYYVHPEIVNSLKFVFDSRSHSDVAQALMNLNRATKRINVVGSFFHAKSLGEAYGLAGGKLFSAKSAFDAALKQLREGGVGDELDLLMREGNLRLEMPEEISPQALAQVGVLADNVLNKMFGSDVHGVEKLGSKIEGLQKNTFDKVTWDYIHIGVKAATALRLMEDYHAGIKGKGMDIKTYRQGVGSFVNDTAGGLDWYQVVSEAKTEAGRKIAMGALKPGARDFLGLAIFAPDWSISTLRAFTKSLPGGTNNPANALFARQYAMRTAILYALALNSINYAISGHFMWDNKDPTRIDLGDGTELQMVKHSMEGVEWVRSPWKTFANKMGFIPKSISMGLTGTQYPGGPKIEGSKAVAIAGQVAPFSSRSFQGNTDMETSAARALLSTMGVTIMGKTEEEKAFMREQRKIKNAQKKFDASTAR